ncbi:hypothetical protein LMG7974_00613 [Campylobacter majalis]|uniref:Flagellar protein FlgN n=1 Tax=Campylobacter majalis TaxID=2790656 RepID=A0ABM8Q4H6_9BACT|nr:flagellar biosynthesis protein FlgN [Campylobacter majalis]CAD7287732.1 hypothetical protein LMG7974_00613 [Campylobacter majalis]
MLKKYLDEAVFILDELIITTKDDIANIKEARHSKVDESVAKKTKLIKEFEIAKKNLDTELVRISKNTSDVASSLDDEIKTKLVIMRERLENLNTVNKEYARHVVLVKEFFDSLTKKMFNIQTDSYSSDGSGDTFYKAKV